MTNRRVCATCGSGATKRLLRNLQKDPPPTRIVKTKPPKKKSNDEKAQGWARVILQKYK